MENIVLTKTTNDKNITEVKGYVDNKVNTESPIENGIELLISLEPYGFKFSNLKIVSYRKGSDPETIQKQIVKDLVDIKNAFLEKSSELMG